MPRTASLSSRRPSTTSTVSASLGAGQRAGAERLDRVAPQRRLVDVADRDAHHGLAAIAEDRREVVGEARRGSVGRALDGDEPSPRPRVVQELLGDPVEQRPPLVAAARAMPSRLRLLVDATPAADRRPVGRPSAARSPVRSAACAPATSE